MQDGIKMWPTTLPTISKNYESTGFRKLKDMISAIDAHTDNMTVEMTTGARNVLGWTAKLGKDYRTLHTASFYVWDIIESIIDSLDAVKHASKLAYVQKLSDEWDARACCAASPASFEAFVRETVKNIAAV